MQRGSLVAVTGATGFLGSSLSERLLSAGYRLRILARDVAKAAPFRGRVEEIIEGDICDAVALDRLMNGVEATIHLVSNFRTASGPAESYTRINLDGTRIAFGAAERAGVKRFVHCSTIGVHGHVRQTPANEESPFNPGDLYQVTKVESELFLRQKMQDSATEIVVIRPCSLYGPGDLRMLKMFRMLAKRRFMLLGPSEEHFHAVYIDDIADGFVRVLGAEGIAGETFIIGGSKYLPLKEYIQAAADAVGAPPPWLKLPYWPVYAVAAVCEALCVPLRIEPPLHRRRVRFYRNNRAFSVDKATRLLGYRPRVDLEEGLKRTVDWYRQQGLL